MVRRKAYKAVLIDYEQVLEIDNIVDIHVCLTRQQAAILKALLITAYWETRWENLSIDKDELEAMVANIDHRLNGGSCAMTFCEDVANCIGESDDVATALTIWNTSNYGSGGVGNPETVLPETIREENLLPEDFACDNDHRYGIADGIVTAIHDATVEVFEAIEVLTDPLELAAEIADNLPVVEVAGITAEIIVWVQDTAYDLYIAAWSTVTHDEIACEIFCLMQDEFPCHLDYEMLMDVYLDDDFPNPPSILDSWLVWAEWWMGLPFTDDTLIVKLGGLMGLLIMRYGGKFGKFVLGVRSLKTTLHLLSDDTNPDWVTLCTECPQEWEHTWNFVTHGMEAWIIDSDYGDYQVGVGVVAEVEYQSGDWKTNIIRYLALAEEIPRCDRFTIHCTIVRGTFDSAGSGVELHNPPEDLKQWNNGHITTGDKTFVNTFPLSNLEYVRVGHARSDHTEGAITGSFIITAVTLRGEGTDPFIERETS